MTQKNSARNKTNQSMNKPETSSFSQKVVIVTGGANGIGKAITKRFAERRARVAIVDVDSKNGRELCESLRKEGYETEFFACDVSSQDAVIRMISEVKTVFRSVEILINNAGISEFKPLFDVDVSDWDRILNTNLRGAFLCAKEAARVMPDKGAIVNISSTRALMSEPGSEAYAASKGGLLALTHALAASLSEKRIRVNAVGPGWIHTGDADSLREIDHRQHLAGRVGSPDDIARACLFLCDPENGFITGENLVIDGGMTRKMIYEH